MTNSPFSKEQISLGTFVSDILNPHQNAKPTTPPNLTYGVDYTSRLDRCIIESLPGDASASLRLRLARLFSAMMYGTAAHDYSVSASEARIYELSQPKALFNQLLQGQRGRIRVRVRDKKI